jgi:hypothetical protein
MGGGPMKNALGYLRPAGSIVSVALFIYLLRRTGAGAVLDGVRLLGWGVVALILLSGVRLVLRAVAWSYCIQTEDRRPNVLKLLEPRLIGDALNDLTPAGPLLGEPVKVAAVSKLIPARAGASSVVIENLVYALGTLLFVLSGLAVASVKLAPVRDFWWIGAGLAICFGGLIAIVYWTMTRRILLLGRTLDCMERLGLRWAFLERHQESLRAVEEAIHGFFLNRRRAFLAILALEIATNFTGIGESYLILRATVAHTSLAAAYLVESASRAAQVVFPFVPLGVGVQEGAAAVTLQALGYAASQGVSLAIIRKIRAVFWAAIGLFFVAKYSMALPGGEKSRIQV